MKRRTLGTGNLKRRRRKKSVGRRDTDYRAHNIPNQPCIFDNADPTRMNYTEELADKWPVGEVHLRALNIATRIYLHLDSATTSLKMVEAPLYKAPWRTEQDDSDPALRSSARTRALARIAHLESGILLLESAELDKTLAIASGNSISVIAAKISDPFENLAADSVKRIIGNIGRTGISMPVAPSEPKIRPRGNHHNLVEHAAHDGERENKRQGHFLASQLHRLDTAARDEGRRGTDDRSRSLPRGLRHLGPGLWEMGRGP